MLQAKPLNKELPKDTNYLYIADFSLLLFYRYSVAKSDRLTIH
ncbi:MAG: hypothetical protein O4807_20765 [Trichodesmium sp. St19_bin2]|nr:hypothetical protein [Trichodesmium sp. St4_bin8_1]MDE5072060.1 hypothetical protein [Trichodesmium sp. St5_bin8]MDE5090481.1 hypothetical protein [Trichodesmium sp. St18_bin3_1_1]MDE5105287.1 hypothetical protein [Trichodesmium sp. St19_bin2]